MQLDWKLQSELDSLFVEVEADAFCFFKALAQLAVWLFSRVYVSETLIKNRTSALASCESSYAISKLPHSHIACHTVDTGTLSWTSKSQNEDITRMRG